LVGVPVVGNSEGVEPDFVQVGKCGLHPLQHPVAPT
jgi:hypothetical protein